MTIGNQAESVGDRVIWLYEHLWSGSQTEMSLQTGIRQGTLSNVLTGKRAPGKTIIHRIAAHPLVDATWLLTGEGPPLRGTAIRPTAGEAALPVATELFLGGPADNPDKIARHLLPVPRALYRSTRYWIEVDDSHPLTKNDLLAIRSGDAVLFDYDLAAQKDIVGHPCIVVQRRGGKKRFCFGIIRSRNDADALRIEVLDPAEDVEPQELDGRNLRSVLLDDEIQVRPRKVLIQTKAIVAVGIYRCGGWT